MSDDRSIEDQTLAVLVERYRALDSLRKGSGGSAEDPYSGGEWYRAQLVAVRDIARALGLYDEMMEAIHRG